MQDYRQEFSTPALKKERSKGTPASPKNGYIQRGIHGEVRLWGGYTATSSDGVPSSHTPNLSSSRQTWFPSKSKKRRSGLPQLVEFDVDIYELELL